MFDDTKVALLCLLFAILYRYNNYEHLRESAYFRKKNREQLPLFKEK